MGLAFVPIYIQYLGGEAWGLVGFMSMLQAWFILLDLGLTPTLSREMARFKAGAHSAQSIRDLMRSLELVYIGVASVVVLSVWFIAPWVGVHWLNVVHLSKSTVASAIGIMGFVLAMRMIEQVYRGAIQGMQAQVWLNAAQGMLATLRWGGAVGVLMFVAPTIEMFFYWQGLVSLVSVIWLAWKTYDLIPRAERRARFDLSKLKEIGRFAGGMAATTLLSLLLTQVDKLLLSKLVTLEVFGYYTLAASVVAALYFLVAPIATAVSPKMAEQVAKSSYEDLVETYHSACQWLSAIMVPAAIVVAMFAEPMLYAWTGDTHLAKQTAPLLSLLAIGTLLNGFMHIPYMAQLAYGWVGLAVRVNIVAVLFIVPTTLWAVPKYGAIGAAWAWVVLNAAYVLVGINFMYSKILERERWRWYIDSILKPLVVGGCAIVFLHNWIQFPLSRLATAFVLLCIGVFMLVIVLFVVPAPRKYLWNRLYKVMS